nr:50S ribosomal protein L5 [Candidatus Njordarchaeum guaymaensis]
MEKVEDIIKKWETNPMLRPKIGYVVVNCSVGKSGEPLQKAMRLLGDITGQKPAQCKAKQTIREFGIRKDEPVACKVTLRGNRAIEFLKKSLSVIDFKLKESSFDDEGNVSFGIKEHIQLPGVRYDPDIGIIGFDVSIRIEKQGYRVARRRRMRTTVPRSHRVGKSEAIAFLQQTLGAKIVGS